jgi:DNA-binding CsgD family transcriptional regulator
MRRHEGAPALHATESRLEELVSERRLLQAVLDSLRSALFVRSADGLLAPLNRPAREAFDDPAFRKRAASQGGLPSSAAELPLEGHAGACVLIVRGSDEVLPQPVSAATTRWRLTRRQAVVLGHVAEGLSNKEIATKLGCAEATVEQHLTIIYRKTRTQGRSGLLALLLELLG